MKLTIKEQRRKADQARDKGIRLESVLLIAFVSLWVAGGAYFVASSVNGLFKTAAGHFETAATLHTK
jgi:Flp pilus assembly pilin Flp